MRSNGRVETATAYTETSLRVQSKPEMEAKSKFDLSLRVNGAQWSGEVPIEETLLEFLRNRLRLTGTKRSCESEVCGACTVLVDNCAISSCGFLAFEADGKEVLTIEGVAKSGKRSEEHTSEL